MLPLVLIVLDGWGHRAETSGNAIAALRRSRIREFFETNPSTLLEASGLAVGLPEGVMGNSEVGHLHIGAGRRVNQLYTQISLDVRDGSFARNAVVREALARAREGGATLHLMGLLSDGAVHSHQEHLYALLRAAAAEGLERVAVHAFLDGRDTPPDGGAGYVERLLSVMNQTGAGTLASMSGRYYAMDRDKRWERTRAAWRMLTAGEGIAAADPLDALRASYARGESDEFVKPHVIGSPQKNRVADGDSVFFFNFRPDRARQLTRAFTEENFDGFERGPRPRLSGFACMARYDDSFALPAAYEKSRVAMGLGETLSKAGVAQFRCAETEKYAHVTYFLNGGREEPWPGEERLLVPSPKAATYDLVPEMSAREVCAAAERRLLEGPARQAVIVNFANPDMVAHTGVWEATLRACETADDCTGRLVDAALSRGGCAFVTADHGNAERMLDARGLPHTAHTTNPVPFVAVVPDARNLSLASGGGLSNAAPTILETLGLAAPPEMKDRSLWKR
jgi:2,3-bisphosphoglycerate-independent phosphoglycerate mutase